MSLKEEAQARRRDSVRNETASPKPGGRWPRVDARGHLPRTGARRSEPFERGCYGAAEIAFGRVEATEELLGLLSVEGDEEERNRDFLADRLSITPEQNTNTVLVSHTPNLEEVGDVTLEEGEAAIYEPLGNGGFEERARLMPEDWSELVGTSS